MPILDQERHLLQQGIPFNVQLDNSPEVSRKCMPLYSKSKQVEIRPFQCETCSRRFKLKSHLKQHQLVHSASAPRHRCYDVNCSRVFKRLSAMRDHFESHHRHMARYNCIWPGCTNSYQGRSNLIIHQRKHTGDRPFPCSLCFKAFSSKGNLKKHARQHTK